MSTLLDPGMWPCGDCQSGMSSNSIFCSGCKHWADKKCTRLRSRLAEHVSFRCARWCGLARPIDGHQCNPTALRAQILGNVDSFCYLGDTINASGGCTHGAIARARSVWVKFRELLPLLTNRYIHNKTHENIFNVCVRSVLLYGNEYWALIKEDKMQLERDDQAMIR